MMKTERKGFGVSSGMREEDQETWNDEVQQCDKKMACRERHCKVEAVRTFLEVELQVKQRNTDRVAVWWGEIGLSWTPGHKTKKKND